MSFWDNIAEALYSNSNTQADDFAAAQQEVAAGQSARYNRLYDQGKIGWLDNLFYQDEISTAGKATRDYENKTGSVLHVLSGVPWFVWLALVGVVFWYLGGSFWLKNIFAPKR